MLVRWMSAGLLLVCLCGGSGSADQPAPARGKTIRITLNQSPMPPRPPGQPIVLPSDTLLVLDTDEEWVVLASPEGSLVVTPEKGPLRARGKFVGGNGVVETRVFPGPFVYIVEVGSGGECELLALPVGDRGQNLIRYSVQAQAQPQPSPKPKPAPVDGTVSWVIVVHETQDTSVELARNLRDKEFWDKLKNRGISWRHYDRNNPDCVAKGYDGFAQEVGLPAVLYLDRTGKVLKKERYASNEQIQKFLGGE